MLEIQVLLCRILTAFGTKKREIDSCPRVHITYHFSVNCCTNSTACISSTLLETWKNFVCVCVRFYLYKPNGGKFYDLVACDTLVVLNVFILLRVTL